MSLDRRKSASRTGYTMAAMTALTVIMPIAARADLELEEIVVTAQKRAENLQDVPIAVSSISGDALQAAGVVDTGALASVASGVAIQQTGQSFQPYIRGVGTPAFGPGVENPVALYVDDVYYVSQVQGIVNMVDVSQVNILKGPQGTLFGRNATGGVIQLTTRDPEADFGGSFRTELDNYLTSRSNLYLTGGVTDALKANVSLSYTTQGEGWGKDINTGNDIDKIDHDIAMRSKWVLDVSDLTKIKLAVDYLDRKSNIGGNYQEIPGASNFIPDPALNRSDAWDVNNPFDGMTTQKGGGASLHVDTDFGFARLVSISAYRTYRFQTSLDSGFNPVPLLDIRYQQLGRQLSEELQLISPKDGKLSWMAGLYYLHGNETGRNADVTLHGAFANFLPGTPDEYVTRTNAVQVIDSIAGFGQGTYEVVSGTNLTLGVRYTDERRKLNGFQFDSQDGSPFFPVDLATGFPAANEADAHRNEKLSQSKMTYRFSVDQKLTDDVMGYLSYNRGFKSGGFNSFRLGSDVQAYRPEIIDAYELGVKSELLDRRLRLNGAGFYNKYKDIQVQKFVGPSAVTVNGARAEYYGIDLDAEMQLTEELHFMSGFEWLHAEFKDYPDADLFNTPAPIAVSGSAAGKTVPYAPKWTANVGFNYTRDTALGKLGLNISESHNDGYFTDASNSSLLRQKSFDLLNAGVSLGVLDDTLTVELWGRNLLNEAVYGLQFAVVPVGYGRDLSNPPRTVGLTATYRFGAKQ